VTDAPLTGSCLCGAVEYEVSGPVLRFLHCHCERCRKATGTGHATNLILKSDGVNWKGNEAKLLRYKLPEAERFATTFCRTCGSPLPREGTGMVVIPAGSLDSLPEDKPQGRIFWDSRVVWSCETDDLPTYAEYPTA
jgi:hypothetical protein